MKCVHGKSVDGQCTRCDLSFYGDTRYKIVPVTEIKPWWDAANNAFQTSRAQLRDEINVEHQKQLGAIKGQLAVQREWAEENFDDLVKARADLEHVRGYVDIAHRVNEGFQQRQTLMLADLAQADTINAGLEDRLADTHKHLGVLAQEVCDNQLTIEGFGKQAAFLEGINAGLGEKLAVKQRTIEELAEFVDQLRGDLLQSGTSLLTVGCKNTDLAWANAELNAKLNRAVQLYGKYRRMYYKRLRDSKVAS